MTKIFFRTCCKSISIILSAVLIFQSSSPAYAQVISSFAEYKNNIGLEQSRRLDEKLEKHFVAESTGVVTNEVYINNPILNEANIIRFKLLYPNGPIPTEEDTNTSATPTYEEFYKEYAKSVNDFTRKYMADIETQKKQFVSEMNLQVGQYILANGEDSNIQAWQKDEAKNIDNWFEESKEKIEELKNTELAKAPAKFKEYEAQIEDSMNKDIFEYVRKEMKALFDLYKKAPNIYGLDQVLLETVPLFIPMNYNGENLLTAEQEKTIFYLAEKQLKKPFTAKVTSINPYISAITAMVNLSKKGESASAPIREAVINSEEHSLFHAHMLITGVSALLAMEDYSSIERILAYFNLQEGEIENVDILSVENLIETIQNIKGKYLGKASSNAQYQLEDGTLSNAWTDIALILAEEGSPKALSILKEYGVDK